MNSIDDGVSFWVIQKKMYKNMEEIGPFQNWGGEKIQGFGQNIYPWWNGLGY